MPTGTVKFFNHNKGYGFIAQDGGGDDAFVHISAVERAGMAGLQENQRIAYELERDQRGKTSAVKLRSAEGEMEGESAEITGIADAEAQNDDQPSSQN